MRYPQIQITRLITILCIIGSILTGLPACTQTVYLVRHAEKECEDCSACGLHEPRGTDRAATLAALLNDKKIDMIYASQCLRTQLTVQPVADAKGIPVTIYHTDELPSLIQKIKAQSHRGILIAGHSNTIPTMVDSLTGQQVFIGDNDYDNLYMITRKSKGANPVLVHKTYGETTQ